MEADDERLERALVKVEDGFERVNINSLKDNEDLDRMRVEEPEPAKETHYGEAPDDSETGSSHRDASTHPPLSATTRKSSHAAALLGNPSPPPRAVILRNLQNYIPFRTILTDGKILTLLTLVVVPPSDTPRSKDPFEPLGQTLAKHSKVRHVPYTKKRGITGTHVPFIRAADVVVFIVSGPPADGGGGDQMEMAEKARSIGGSRPFILVSCFDIRQCNPSKATFPTPIQIPGYTSSDLEAAATILLSEKR